MAPSTPPPPLDTSNTVASTTTTTTRPVFQYPARPPNPHPIYSPPPTRLPSNPNPNYPQLAPRPPHPHPQDPTQLLYPVASSGRGFISRPVPMPVARPSPRPPYVFPYLDQGQGNPGFVRPNHLPHVLLGSGPGSAVNATGAGVMPSVVNGIPIPTSHHPKVRISDNASLYTLCRSWLRNSYPEETQPQYLDTVKSLPRPLPVASQAVDSPDKTAEDKEDEDEDKSLSENLSEKELLQRHIKRAKRVRSRLREERLRRITRYKMRLAMLLPPMVEQQFKHESASANCNKLN